MNIEQFIVYLENVETAVKRELQTKTIIAANDLSSLIADRVTVKGLNANGQAFSPYSQNAYYASSFKGKGRNASSDTRISSLGRGAKITYGQFREINNLKSTPKNFSFTNDMWRNHGVKEATYSNGVAVVGIGGKSESAIEKINFLSKQEGINIAAASQSEIQIVGSLLNKWILGLF